MAKTLLEQERPTTMIDALGDVRTLMCLFRCSSNADEAATKEMAKTLLEQERPTTMIDALGNVSTLGDSCSTEIFRIKIYTLCIKREVRRPPRRWPRCCLSRRGRLL